MTFPGINSFCLSAIESNVKFENVVWACLPKYLFMDAPRMQGPASKRNA